MDSFYLCFFIISDAPLNSLTTGLDKHNLQRTILNIFLLIILTYVLDAQKNRLFETVLLTTHNICFGWEIRK